MVGFDMENDGVGDMSPEDAAAYARDETGGGGAEGPSGGNTGFGSSSTGPLDRLLDGDAQGPPTSELQRDYSVGNAPAIMLRGVLRTATGSGVPPIAEILMGGFLWLKQNQESAEPNETAGEIATNSDGVRTGPQS